MQRFRVSRCTAIKATVVVFAVLAALVPVTTNLDQLEKPPHFIDADVVPPPSSGLVAEAAEARKGAEYVTTSLAAANFVDQPKVPGVSSAVLQAATEAVAARIKSGGTLRVGIQAGHWKNAELPDELSVLRGSTGATGISWKEVDVNLTVAQKVTGLLSHAGVLVDLLPATVPVSYKADAFVAIHADANADKSFSGCKAARATKSAIPQKDDALVAFLSVSYQSVTGLSWDTKTITQNMLEHYSFDQRFAHSVDPTTPSAILEMGFLTNAKDNRLLMTQPDTLAQAVTLGILQFLAK